MLVVAMSSFVSPERIKFVQGNMHFQIMYSSNFLLFFRFQKLKGFHMWGITSAVEL